MYRRAALRALDYVMRHQDIHSSNPERGDQVLRRRDEAMQSVAIKRPGRESINCATTALVGVRSHAPTSLAQNRRQAASTQYVKRAALIRLCVGIHDLVF
jgi:hypothetical protein